MSEQTIEKSSSGSSAESTHGVPISLKKLTKRYPGTEKAAVDAVDMEIPAGEIVVFVGPSGCGKTTTMRMINRMIAPSDGVVEIDGEDVASLNDTTLRRRIGYVIQQIGLIPHLTIASNVALVPKLLGWDKKRIAKRVDEMLTVVGLDPEQYRDRYPRQLSGGQQQRVGVARALAADPPIMLMDEPFGAVDPITRGRLQEEFRTLQKTLKKTIVFVTHDFDEALKLGDRIAVLREGSQIAQYDTPENILANPADDFVSGFIGEGAALKRLYFEPVSSVPLEPATGAAGDVSVTPEDNLHHALDTMVGKGLDSIPVVDGGRVTGSVSVQSILARVGRSEAGQAR
ncbi:ABC transporter ATP-binding protein [Nocardioides sp. CFH 31398]|uniref:ABC transporter ATP-binding protein n=1 Tax=Nocardioides sp. CFH 31398 TaxID=2919579 RepID=UPI001F05ED63|nr:ABC transporter ATP-binding protein [Nocardioides sp. CFH 31398]MCH1867258.1 ABC transporter ATP-binding protein [Nocardioides sp. CFH 31398]